MTAQELVYQKTGIADPRVHCDISVGEIWELMESYADLKALDLPESKKAEELQKRIERVIDQYSECSIGILAEKIMEVIPKSDGWIPVTERLKYAEIDSELKRAERKHPDFPTDMFRQLAIMQEEAGEVTKAVLHYHYENGTLEHIKEELIQTAAMCMRMLQNLPLPSPPQDIETKQ